MSRSIGVDVWQVVISLVVVTSANVFLVVVQGAGVNWKRHKELIMTTIAEIIKEIQSDKNAIVNRVVRELEAVGCGDIFSDTPILKGMFQDKGQLDEAEEIFRSALAIIDAAHGPDHPSTGISVGSLAVVLRDKGQLDEAEEMCHRALANIDATLGPHHPCTVFGRGHLGIVLMLRGDKEGDGQKAAGGRAAVEEALRFFRAPPYSLSDVNPCVVEFSGFLLASE